MKEAALVLADHGFGRSAAGLVYGGLYIQADKSKFPDPHWTDFVVIVLAWWCRALSHLLVGEERRFEVRFMEGPYFAEISQKSAHSIHLKLVEAGSNYRARFDEEVQTHVLIGSVLAASARVLAECEARGWWSDDADELASAMEALRQENSRALI